MDESEDSGIDRKERVQLCANEKEQDALMIWELHEKETKETRKGGDEWQNDSESEDKNREKKICTERDGYYE